VAVAAGVAEVSFGGLPKENPTGFPKLPGDVFANPVVPKADPNPIGAALGLLKENEALFGVVVALSLFAGGMPKGDAPAEGALLKPNGEVVLFEPKSDDDVVLAPVGFPNGEGVGVELGGTDVKGFLS